MRAAIIVKPAKSDTAELRKQVDKTLAAAGWAPSLWLETTPTDPGAGMAEAAVEAGVQLVMICGGDGTVMACLDALSRSGLPVAVLPLGSGNLLARNLGIPLEFDESLNVAVNGDDRLIDLGRVGDQPFAVMAGMGLDAAMMADTTERMKRVAGWPAYVASALRHLRDPVMRVQLSIDGGPPVSRSARTVLVGNVGELEGGLELLPAASVDDGLLDVVIVAPRKLRDWVRVAYRIVRKPHTRDRHLEHFAGQAISIEADREVPRQVDGEVIDDGRHIDARVEPGALIVRVPRSSAAAA
ncbi:diacylglycerol/lipid kinase family protein [Mycolicibacterium stellerae]|uniref:diacylglycerol/lipid kinase family protein n=1 Tax=Mycolicibacterium stellerae TaxID=2358193 RepID=UPI000F0BB88F|nr:diacylglycerol kinase family protein [Mycolicibacterium stellerae]